MNLLFPLLGLGLTAGGVLAGTLQQNFSEKRTEIDKFFDEIVEQIRKFSKKYPITEEQLEKIKNSQISLSEDEFRKKRDVSNNNQKKSKNTFDAWVYIWIQLSVNYVTLLWGNSKKHPVISTSVEKNNALEKSDEYLKKNDWKRFKEVFDSEIFVKIEEIYKKLKDFILLTDVPNNYTTGNSNIAYEDYIRKLIY